MRLFVVIALAASAFACSSKGVSFEGAKFDTELKPSPVPPEKSSRLGEPAIRAPFAVKTEAHANWMLGQGMLVSVWHESGDGTGEEVRMAIAEERKPEPAPHGNMPVIARRGVDELSETANYLAWKRHTQMVGGLGANERYLIAKAEDGSLHRWSAFCMDLLQEARCPPLMDTFTLEKPADFTAP